MHKIKLHTLQCLLPTTPDNAQKAQRWAGGQEVNPIDPSNFNVPFEVPKLEIEPRRQSGSLTYMVL